MRNREITCLRIDIGQKRFFFSNQRIELLENFSTDSRLVFYQPRILTSERSVSALSFDGSAPVFTIEFDIEDSSYELKRAFERNDYEQALVYVKTIYEDETLESYLGSLGDVSVEDGKVSLTARFSEEGGNSELLNQFSDLTFQKFENIIPSQVGYQGNWQKFPDVPWQIYAIDVNRTSIGFQPKFGAYRETGGILNPTLIPQVSRILLKPTTIAALTMEYSEINNTVDINPDVPGNDKYLETGLTKAYPLFEGFYSGPDNVAPTTFPAQYFDAWIGPGHRWTNDNSPELFRYAFFGEGYYQESDNTWQQTPGKFWLSGIPAAEVGGSFTPSSLDPIGLGAPWETDNFLYRLKKKHAPNDIIAPARQGTPATATGGVDYIWFKANGFVPEQDDPEFGVGFLYLGKTYQSVQTRYLGIQPQLYSDAVAGNNFVNPDILQDYKVFHRYTIVDVIPDVYDYNTSEGEWNTTTPFTLIKVAIQDHPLDDESHPYALRSVWMANGTIETSMDESTPVEIYTYEYMLGYMDILISNITNEEYAKLSDATQRNLLKDRYRGILLSMIEDFNSFKSSLSNSSYFNLSNVENGQIEKENANLINNATSKFAVVSGSEIIYGDDNPLTPEEDYVVERLYFHVPDVGSKGLMVPLEDSTDLDVANGTITGRSVQASRTRDKIFSNYMTFKPTFTTASEQSGLIDYGEEQVSEFFLTGRYRIIYDPVPENSSDLGKFFPIVYGYVKRVPLLQCISKKTLMEGNESAGDDYYVYASHRCNVNSAFDITLEFINDFDSKTLLSDGTRRQIELSSLKDEFAKSPFPNVEKNHYYIVESSVTSLGEQTSTSTNKANLIYNPYHRIENKVSNDGFLYYGIQLRGNEWDSRLGRLNRHYPIRNGLGSSVLYGTFSGWIDETGEYTGKPNQVITHPIDIIKHFILNYGDKIENVYGVNYDNLDFIDLESAEFVKSKTRKYEASVFITENIGVADFIDSLCRQFGIYWYIYGSKIYFSLGEIDFIDYNKPIHETHNLIRQPSERSEGYKDIYTKITYNLKYNYINSEYDTIIKLDKKNNRYCSKNSRAIGNSKDFVIDGMFQNNYSVAKEVSLKYAKYLCTRRIVYTIEVRRVDGIKFYPGEVIPLTYSRFDMYQTPVLIKSVKSEKDSYVLDVIRFPDIEPTFVEEPITPPEPPFGDPVPFVLIEPVISGIMKEGQTLTSTTGSWLYSPISYAYQWKRDGVNIGGETSSTYTVIPTDIRSEITCQVIASNLTGPSLPALSNTLSSPLREIFLIDPDARVWSHEQGISTGLAVGVENWITVDGLYTLTQGTLSRRPTRNSDGIVFDGNSDYMTSDSSAFIFNSEYSVLMGITDLSTVNTTRTVFSSTTNGLSTGTRRLSAINFSIGTAASLTRMRFLLGGNSSANQVDLRSVWSNGPSYIYNLAVRSDVPGTGSGEGIEMTTPITSLNSRPWVAVTMANDLMTVGALRIVSATANTFWQGKMKYFIATTIKLTDLQISTIRDALIAEGLTI